MITREEVKEILAVLEVEYTDMLPKNDKQATLKIDTWHAMLSIYSFGQVKSATYQLLSGKVYGKPNISDLMEILNPKMEQVNEGAEFAFSIMDLHRKYGTDGMEPHVSDLWGNVGHHVYSQAKEELRLLLEKNVSTFRAQLRDVYNSYKEREKYGQLPSELQIEIKERALLCEQDKCMK